jgi:glucans biosynthesis protein C
MNRLTSKGLAPQEAGIRFPQRMEPSGSRLIYIDNLRWTMIILVISMHAADTYSPFGNWYFVDRGPLSPASVLVFGAWQTYLQSFFMGLLFFIAGYFVPASFARKGLVGFLRDRSVRLGIPVLLYMFCIGPLTEYYLAHSWTSTKPTSFAKEWIDHIRNGQVLQENGPLWFCLALLIFCASFALLQSVPRRGTDADAGQLAPSNRNLVAFAIVMASLSFLVRVGRPSSVLNLHLEDFPQYILLFSGGIAAGRRKWLCELKFADGMRWLSAVLPVGLGVWLTLFLAVGELQGRGADASGGWHWQSGVFCLWESFTCVAMSFGLLVLYREKFNAQGRLAKFLSENAFSVYVFHPPVVVFTARLMRGLFWPPLIKFVALTWISAAAIFGLSALLFRRIPVLRRIL